MDFPRPAGLFSLLSGVNFSSAGLKPRPEPSGSDTGLWSGMEEITVVLGTHKAVVCLKNMPVSRHDEIRGISQADIDAQALLEATPEG